jgi:hypothetical protein
MTQHRPKQPINVPKSQCWFTHQSRTPTDVLGEAGSRARAKSSGQEASDGAKDRSPVASVSIAGKFGRSNSSSLVLARFYVANHTGI